jgi:hypothetical protein
VYINNNVDNTGNDKYKEYEPSVICCYLISFHCLMIHDYMPIVTVNVAALLAINIAALLAINMAALLAERTKEGRRCHSISLVRCVISAERLFRSDCSL